MRRGRVGVGSGVVEALGENDSNVVEKRGEEFMHGRILVSQMRNGGRG